jgi:hypothetical protein
VTSLSESDSNFADHKSSEMHFRSINVYKQVFSGVSKTIVIQHMLAVSVALISLVATAMELGLGATQTVVKDRA